MEPSASLNVYDFLDRMRHPSAMELVRSIKSFIVSFSFNTYDAERDSKKLQDFLVSTEAIIRDHPVWTGATDEEIDNAIEGLEKYLMTKLFNRVFASVPEDSKHDVEITEKIRLLQCFIKPEHLDIPKHFQNASSWLLAEKELQKINTVKAPREKLMCIFNCCHVINNLLLNVSMSSHHKPAGADDFLSVIIYITIKANPPKLHSNLKYIQLYRRQSRLISETAYYFTTMISVKSFIVDVSSASLSMDESEFESSMQAATLSIAVPERRNREGILLSDLLAAHKPGSVPVQQTLETKSWGNVYPFMEAEIGDLTREDTAHLLHLYKDVALKYLRLCDAVKSHSLERALAIVDMDERAQITSRLGSAAILTEKTTKQHEKE